MLYKLYIKELECLLMSYRQLVGKLSWTLSKITGYSFIWSPFTSSHEPPLGPATHSVINFTLIQSHHHNIAMPNDELMNE